MSERVEDSSKKYTVYVHTAPNGKKYVGTTSKGCEERWHSGWGYYSQKFFKAIKEYGWNNIEHEIVLSGLNEEDAYKVEKVLIWFLHTTDERFGYNRSIGGKFGGTGVEAPQYIRDLRSKLMNENNPFKGKHHSEETKRKISEAMIGKYCGVNSSRYGDKDTPEQIERKRILKSKPIDMYDKNGNYIKSFLNSLEAEKETGCNHSNITRVCKRKAKTIHGYIFRYKGDSVA